MCFSLQDCPRLLNPAVQEISGVHVKEPCRLSGPPPKKPRIHRKLMTVCPFPSPQVLYFPTPTALSLSVGKMEIWNYENPEPKSFFFCRNTQSLRDPEKGKRERNHGLLSWMFWFFQRQQAQEESEVQGSPPRPCKFVFPSVWLLRKFWFLTSSFLGF